MCWTEFSMLLLNTEIKGYLIFHWKTFFSPAKIDWAKLYLSHNFLLNCVEKSISNVTHDWFGSQLLGLHFFCFGFRLHLQAESFQYPVATASKIELKCRPHICHEPLDFFFFFFGQRELEMRGKSGKSSWRRHVKIFVVSASIATIYGADN